ncbi:MAG: hypothetical protein ACTSX6_05140 [Candidatus Heimdallarchaeaceae archaeon]
MHDINFSDYWYIDIPCYMAFFSLMILSLLASLINVETSLDYLVHSYDPSFRHLVAPFVEETFKFLTVLLGIPFAVVFTAIFAIQEAQNYITFATNNHFGTTEFYIMRVICIGVHFLTLGSQIFCFKMYLKYKYGVYLLLGYTSSIFIHLEWNTIAGKFVYVNVLDYYSDLSQYLGL